MSQNELNKFPSFLVREFSIMLMLLLILQSFVTGKLVEKPIMEHCILTQYDLKKTDKILNKTKQNEDDNFDFINVKG